MSEQFKPKTDKVCALCNTEKNIFNFQQFLKGKTWVNVCHGCVHKLVYQELDRYGILPGEHSFNKMAA